MFIYLYRFSLLLYLTRVKLLILVSNFVNENIDLIIITKKTFSYPKSFSGLPLVHQTMTHAHFKVDALSISVPLPNLIKKHTLTDAHSQAK